MARAVQIDDGQEPWGALGHLAVVHVLVTRELCVAMAVTSGMSATMSPRLRANGIDRGIKDFICVSTASSKSGTLVSNSEGRSVVLSCVRREATVRKVDQRQHHHSLNSMMYAKT
jgi:hypothetical protein